MLVVAQWPLEYPSAGDSKLRAARSADLRWSFEISALVRRCSAEYLSPYLRRHMLILPVFRKTAWIPIAAKVDVAVFLHEKCLERFKGVDVGMERRVGVPGRQEAGTMRMDKCHYGREGGIVFDDICQVCHGFMALVCRGGECSI